MSEGRRLAAIMFTDLVGSTATAQKDEEAALRRQVEQEEVLRPIFRAHGGREIKSTGDGFLVEFESALRATECAVEVQRDLRNRNTRVSTPPLLVRIGIHLGDVEPRNGDIFGDAVNIASRLEPLAEPGGVCLSESVYLQVRNRVAFQLERVGTKTLKGVLEPFTVYRVVLPWDGPAEPFPPQRSNLPRLAVLPLVNISADPKDEYFADGLTEELITVLSQIGGLRVISRTSVNQYKGTTKSIAQIGSELGVDSVLEGSVRKEETALRIAVQLIDTRTDEHRWAQTYDRKLDNVFAIQADVAEQTAGALKVQLLKSERDAIRERPTSSLAAYDLYLQGIQAFRAFTDYSGDSDEADRRAEQLLEAAIREDPNFTSAYSYLANHLITAAGMTRPARSLFPRARQLAARALSLNPNSSDAHVAQGNLAMQADLDWTRAEAEFQQAIALNPSSSTARTWYGYLLQVLQRFDEARKQDLAAINLDPFWSLPRVQLDAVAWAIDDHDSDIAQSEELNKLFGHSMTSRTGLAWAYFLGGRTEDSTKLLESVDAESGLYARSSRATLLAFMGRPSELRALLDDWEAGRISEYVSPVELARWFAVAGDRERAIASLEQDHREGDRTLWNDYQAHALDPIREDPRFVAMLEAMHLPTTLRRRLRLPPSLPPN